MIVLAQSGVLVIRLFEPYMNEVLKYWEILSISRDERNFNFVEGTFSTDGSSIVCSLNVHISMCTIYIYVYLYVYTAVV